MLFRRSSAFIHAIGACLQGILDDVFRELLDRSKPLAEEARAHVLARFRDSIERNRRLGELLSK